MSKSENLTKPNICFATIFQDTSTGNLKRANILNHNSKIAIIWLKIPMAFLALLAFL